MLAVMMYYALARWLSWLEYHPIHQKVAGSIPGSGMYGRQPVNVSLSHWCFSSSLSLSPALHKKKEKKRKKCPQVRIIKKKCIKFKSNNKIHHIATDLSSRQLVIMKSWKLKSHPHTLHAYAILLTSLHFQVNCFGLKPKKWSTVLSAGPVQTDVV